MKDSWPLSDACGDTSDLAHPEREMFATREAARHSGPLGALLVGTDVLQVTCHLNRVTDPILILNKPISAVQLLQKICKNFGGVASAAASELQFAACAGVDMEN